MARFGLDGRSLESFLGRGGHLLDLLAVRSNAAGDRIATRKPL